MKIYSHSTALKPITNYKLYVYMILQVVCTINVIKGSM